MASESQVLIMRTSLECSFVALRDVSCNAPGSENLIRTRQRWMDAAWCSSLMQQYLGGLSLGSSDATVWTIEVEEHGRSISLGGRHCESGLVIAFQ
eukprot:257606-Amphidinium_carterae.1